MGGGVRIRQDKALRPLYSREDMSMPKEDNTDKACLKALLLDGH